jgi:hypothetical protein
MGVFFLLAYIFGALLITFGSLHLVRDVLDGSVLTDGLVVLVVGIGVALLGGLMHAIVARRRQDAGLLEAVPPMGGRMLALCVGLWLVPPIFGWVQFELFIDPVRMFPGLTIAGASLLVLGLVARVLEHSRLRWPAACVAVAVVGIPLGLATVLLPARHFLHHMTDVRVSVSNPETHESKEFVFQGDSPEFHSGYQSDFGPELGGLLEAIADAETVDLEEEIAAGRMKRLDDGSYATVRPDGSTVPTGGKEDLLEAWAQASESDREWAARQREQERMEWQMAMEARKRGGRIFSR